MTTSRREILAMAALGLPALSLPALAADDAYPSRNIRIIVATTPGGITDVLARLLGDYIERATGASSVIENIGGAGGNIGTAQVARAAPDGYTLGIASSGGIEINPFLYKNMTFDPQSDLVAIAPLGAAPQMVMVNAKSPYRSLKDLVEDARAHPGEVNYGSAGVGTTPHLSGAMLERIAGIHMTHVPYRGSAPAVADLVGGRIQMLAIGAQPVISFIREGVLRPLAVTDAHRLANLPEVPTTAEAGYPGYEVSSWFGLVAARDTPAPVVTKLAAIVHALHTDPAELKLFDAASFVPMDMAPSDFAALIKRESTAWGALIREAGITAE